MTSDLQDHAARHGFMTRPQVLDSGFDDRSIADALRSGAWLRIGHGLYAPASYRQLTPEQQHVVRCHAEATRLGEAVAFSHQSAAALHGAATWGVDDDVHVTRLDTGRGRREAGVAHHVGRIAERDVVEVDGLLVVPPARMVWEVASTTSTESGLVTVDSALHRGVVALDDLRSVATHFEHWRGSRHARLTLSLSDGKAESPGESRTRYFFWRHGVPTPTTQWVLRDDRGRFVARTDFGWVEHRHVAEFDGRVKYRVDTDDPREATRILADEKAREDAVRALGLGVSRVVWADLEPVNEQPLLRRIRADLDRSHRLYAH